MRSILFALVTVVLTSALPAQAIRTLPNKTARQRRVYREILGRLASYQATVIWKEKNLVDAIKDLRSWSGLNIVVGRELKARVEEETVDMVLTQVKLLSVMMILGEQFDIVFQNRRGILWVTTPEDALKRSLVLGIYPIQDLLYTPPDFPAPRVLGIEPGPPAQREEEEPEDREGKDPEQIITLIRSSMGAKVWEPEGVSINHMNGKIVVRHSPEVQARVRRFLNRLRGAL